jgi:hypothetical protein
VLARDRLTEAFNGFEGLDGFAGLTKVRFRTGAEALCLTPFTRTRLCLTLLLLRIFPAAFTPPPRLARQAEMVA